MVELDMCRVGVASSLYSLSEKFALEEGLLKATLTHWQPGPSPLALVLQTWTLTLFRR